MTTNDRVRMTMAQQAVLESARQDGHLGQTDRRVIKGLIRRGWVREQVGRRGRRSWYITAAGQMALDNAPEIVPPRVRPNWRYWEHERLTQGHYLVEGHELVRPAQGMLWHVHCPDLPDKPVGYRQILAEAVELLAEHLMRKCAQLQESGWARLTSIGASRRGT